MARPYSLQVYVTEDVAARVRAAASERKTSVSAWLRALVIGASDQVPPARSPRIESDALARQSVFVSVALDALLAGHADPQLRARTHTAYARKLEQMGLRETPTAGGDDEA